MTDKPKMRIQSITMDGSRVTDIEVVPVDAITGTQRCEPPEHLRGVDGWHWLRHPGWGEWPARYSAPCHAGVWPIWQCPDSNWTTPAAHREGWRYLAPVTPPSTVAALVEALEAADQFIRNGIEFGYIRMPSPSTPDPALETPDKVANALALYRGEVA